MQDRQLYDVNIKAIKPLYTPRQLIHSMPLSVAARQTVLKGREQIVEILDGKSDRLLVIVGPCSIHDPESAFDYAGRLSRLAQEISNRILVVMRVYFDKPRTTIGWKGFINDPNLDGTFNMAEGLKQARKLLLEIAEVNLLAATEFVNPIVPQYLADLVSWNAIGARTIESQTHRELASGLSMPIGCKNGTGGNDYSITIAVDAIDTIRYPHSFQSVTLDGISAEINSNGNPWGHLVLRGGQAGTNYDDRSIAYALQSLTERGLRSNLVVDCSHGNSRKDHTQQPGIFQNVVGQRIAGNNRIIGLMVESHLHPGNQKLGSPSELSYGVSITDACIGWKETEYLLRWAHAQLAAHSVATS